MERMDAVRRAGGVMWVVAGLVIMCGWSLTAPPDAPGLVTWTVVAVIGLGAGALLTARDSAWRWWAGRVAGVVIGVELLGAVGDRFGLLGAPGAPGVSWGDWGHFRAETAELVPWSVLVEPAAVVATVAELALGVLLLLGMWWRWVGKATAGLFTIYLAAMISGMGAASVLQFGVPVLIGGALLASARGTRTGRRAPDWGRLVG